MIKEQIILALSALLHNVDCICSKADDRCAEFKNSSCFLENELNICDSNIIDFAQYHHYEDLKSSNLKESSTAYILYAAKAIASNNLKISSSNSSKPLESVFNLLNNNNKKGYYSTKFLNDKINYPVEKPDCTDKSFYNKAYNRLVQVCKSIDFANPKRTDISSLLEVLELIGSYVPYGDSNEDVNDISIFDHLKLTAAYASCIYNYFESKNIDNYKKYGFEMLEEFFNEKAFILYSLDLSGIQSFIYTINIQGALKTLRARSFYLEIFMEHIIDTLLTELSLSRANIIYSGGGHCYLLLANTDNAKRTILNFEKSVNAWLIDNFQSDLYVASGFAECCANELRNIPGGRYSQLFANISKEMSIKKLHRYSASDIIKMNNLNKTDGLRECKCCKTMSKLVKVMNYEDKTTDVRCEFCNNLIAFSNYITSRSPKPYFAIVMTKNGNGLKLPFDCRLTAMNTQEVEANKSNILRIYSKEIQNDRKTEATHIWVGDYCTNDNKTDLLAEKSTGINRIAVFRADVDNLGKAFVQGFNRNDCGSKYVTLSRTAALSRQLSLFFKNHINSILSNGEYDKISVSGNRNISIVYSGGDDVFVVGAWDDVMSFSVDLSSAFKKFTEGSLSISAGIGVYTPEFPISISAKEVEKLEDMSKGYTLNGSEEPIKNALTLFDNRDMYESKALSGYDLKHTYGWNEFDEKVVSEKLATLKSFFGIENNSDKNYGNSFLYNLLFLIRNAENDKINYARYVYLLSRMEPKNDENLLNKYKIFSQKMYDWIRNYADRKELITAIYIYTYLTRKRGD